MLSPEAQLVIACARCTVDREAVRRCARTVTAWDAVYAMAEAHAVAPLVTFHLSANASDLVREPALTLLSGARHRCAIRNLSLLQELVRITSALRSVGVEAISYKGPLLARDVYGDWSLRESADLDLIIRRSDFARMHAVLADAGYRSAQVLDQSVEEARLASEGQCQFVRGDFSLDVHSRAFQPYLWSQVDTESWFARACETSAGNGTALVLHDDDLMLALVLHGTMHSVPRG